MLSKEYDFISTRWRGGDDHDANNDPGGQRCLSSRGRGDDCWQNRRVFEVELSLVDWFVHGGDTSVYMEYI